MIKTIYIELLRNDYERLTHVLQIGIRQLCSGNNKDADHKVYYGIIQNIVIQANQQLRKYEHQATKKNNDCANAKQTKQFAKPR